MNTMTEETDIMKKYSGVQVLKMVRSALDGALHAVDDYNQEIINALEEALKKDAGDSPKCAHYKKKEKEPTQLEIAKQLHERAKEQGKRIEKMVEDMKSLFKEFPIPEVPDDDRWKKYRPEEVNDWICSDCGAPSKLVLTGFLDHVKPKCTVCGSGNATVVSKQETD